MQKEIKLNRFDLFGAAIGLMTFYESGLLQQLELYPGKSLTEMVEYLKIDPEGAKLLLDLMVELGVVEKSKDYAGPSGSLGRHRYALSETFTDLDHRLGSLTQDVRHWSRIRPFVLEGIRIADLTELRSREDHYSYKSNLDALLEPLAELFAEVNWYRSLNRVLDLGAGTGIWTRFMKGEELVCLDLPEVIRKNEDRYLKASGFERVNTVSTDWWNVIWNIPFDRIVMGNILHLEDANHAEALLAKAFYWLKPGGDLLVIGSFGGHHEKVGMRLYDLSLAMRTKTGKNHRIEQIQAWASAVGFVRGRFFQLGFDCDPEPRSIACQRFVKQK